MTVSSTTSFIILAGNSSATSFAFNFEIPYQSDGTTVAINVWKIGANGQLTLLTITTDYTVTGVGVAAGGTVAYPVSGSALPTGQYLFISRALPDVQATAFTNTGFLPSSVETALDTLVLQSQQTANELARLILAPCLVSALPLAVENINVRGMVTDATATTFGSTVAGSGANVVPVVSNGANWIIG